MGRSFDIVDFKVAESEFFLRKISECGFNLLEAQFFVNAFASSSRSITYSLQSCLSKLDGFDFWYSMKQNEMKKSPLATFFHAFRNFNQHIGDTLINSGEIINGKSFLYFTPVPEIKSVPEEDVETACTSYFILLLTIIYDCYIQFGPIIDAKQRYTSKYFSEIGKTIEDAEEEVLIPQAISFKKAFLNETDYKNIDSDINKLKAIVRGWTYVPGYSEEYRWQALRDSEPGCGINNIFLSYLGKTTPEPVRLPELTNIPDEEGWSMLKVGGCVYIPKSLRKTGDPNKDIELYLETLRKKFKK